MSTLWYHDHRVDFTSQNTYKGLFGFYCLFNQFDTGNDDSGFRLPDFPQHDIPLAFSDKVYDPETGELVFDLFNLDGILGDKFLLNGMIQPFFNVEPRRYRFRLLDTGPSRFYEFFLTDLRNLSATNPYWLIGTDGNLLPNPIQIKACALVRLNAWMSLLTSETSPAGPSTWRTASINSVDRGPRQLIVRSQPRMLPARSAAWFSIQASLQFCQLEKAICCCSSG